MIDVLNGLFDDMTTFNPQHYKNMTVVGINVPEKNKVDLMSLERGLDLGLVEISEVNEGGSVGEVKVINKAVTPLLILDGEEIIGSKQNRVVNATIIIDAKSEKIIPVSCTEAGRWKYKSKKFHYSNHMASSRLRRDKLKSVSHSLRNGLNYTSNQQKVWHNISKTEEELNICSNTSALHDAYKQKTNDIDEYQNAFKLNDKQNGMMVYINGKIVGLELIYNTTRYKEYHDKLLESYIIDAISQSEVEYDTDKLSDEGFIDDIRKSEYESYDSVGQGVDYRVEKDNISGSAVVYNDSVINASFFSKERMTESMQC